MRMRAATLHPTPYAAPAYAHSGHNFISMRSQPAYFGGGGGRTAEAWRSRHPGWSGGYYYHNGAYFYDSGFGHPALMTNEWGSIAVTAGAVALEGALSHDPTLFFAGSVGGFYSLDRFGSDRYADGPARLRYAYFNRPYFWRSGVRYNRISVVVNGGRGYEFRRA